MRTSPVRVTRGQLPLLRRLRINIQLYVENLYVYRTSPVPSSVPTSRRPGATWARPWHFVSECPNKRSQATEGERSAAVSQRLPTISQLWLEAGSPWL